MYKSLLVLGYCLLLSLAISPSYAFVTDACGEVDEFEQVLTRLEQITAGLSSQAQGQLDSLSTLIDNIIYQDDDLINPIRISSVYNGGDNTSLSIIYSENRWIVDDVKIQPHLAFQANDMVRKQLLYLRSSYDLPKKLPKEIVLNLIDNEETFDSLANISPLNKQEEFLEEFLKTPDGEMMKLMLEDLQMKATKAYAVSSLEDEVSDFLYLGDSIIVDVEPLSPDEIIRRDLQALTTLSINE